MEVVMFWSSVDPEKWCPYFWKHPNLIGINSLIWNLGRLQDIFLTGRPPINSFFGLKWCSIFLGITVRLPFGEGLSFWGAMLVLGRVSINQPPNFFFKQIEPDLHPIVMSILGRVVFFEEQKCGQIVQWIPPYMLVKSKVRNVTKMPDKFRFRNFAQNMVIKTNELRYQVLLVDPVPKFFNKGSWGIFESNYSSLFQVERISFNFPSPHQLLIRGTGTPQSLKLTSCMWVS